MTSTRRTASSLSSSSFLGTQYRIRSVVSNKHQQNPKQQQHYCRYYSGASTLRMMPEGPEVRTLVDQLVGSNGNGNGNFGGNNNNISNSSNNNTNTTTNSAIGKRLVDLRFLSGRYIDIEDRPNGFKEFAQTMTPLLRSPIDDQSYLYDDDDDDATTATSKKTIDTIVDWNCKGKFIYIILDNGRRKRRKKQQEQQQQEEQQNKDDTNDINKNKNNEKNDNDDYQRSIWITLGMTGRFVNEMKHLQDPSYGRWVLEFVDNENSIDDYQNYATDLTSMQNTNSAGDYYVGGGTAKTTKSTYHKIYYHDKRNFGTLKFSLSKQELQQKLESLGPDVLQLAVTTKQQQRIDTNNQDDKGIIYDEEKQSSSSSSSSSSSLLFLEILEEQTNNKRRKNPNPNICKFLMDQKKLSGVGNYILSEALYRADIDPFAGIQELSKIQRLVLWQELQNVTYESYMSQKKSTNSNTTTTMGYTSVRELEPYDFQLQCYGKNNCPKGYRVMRETNGPHGRTIWYTEQQLFMSRYQRQYEEDVLLAEQQQNKRISGAKRNDNNNNKNKNDDGAVNNKSENNVAVTSLSSSSLSSSSSSSSQSLSLLRQYIDDIKDPGWRDALGPYVTGTAPTTTNGDEEEEGGKSASSSSSSLLSSFLALENFVQNEYDTYGEENIYPPKHLVFNALNLCPLHKVKVVILGQDPYHGPDQATGLAFSVSQSIPTNNIPPSLKNIFKELDNNYNHDRDRDRSYHHYHGDLTGWAEQGILMLNTCLTVRRGQANSHKNRGWEDFTDEIVRILLTRKEQNNGDGNNGIVFLLWGNPAAKKAKSVLKANNSSSNHDNTVVIITTSHPSPLGATKTKTPFLTSNCFSRVNDALIEMGQEPIDWYQR